MIEMIVTVGILLVILGLSAPFTINLYSRYQVDSERNMILALLRQARAMSMAGEGGTDHGVYISSSSFTLFEGQNYQSRNISKDREIERSNVSVVTVIYEFIFRYKTGNATSGNIIIENNAKQNTIYVNTEGRIDWE